MPTSSVKGERIPLKENDFNSHTSGNGSTFDRSPGPSREKKSSSGGGAPDGGWGWFVILAAHSTLIFREGIAKCLGVFLDTFRLVFHADTALVGWVSSLCVTTADFTGLVSGPCCRKFGCRPVAVVGGLFAGLGLTCAAFSSDLASLGICLCISGFGLGLSLTPSLTMVSRYFDKRYSLANGLAYAGSGVGILILAPLAQVLLDTYGWKGALAVMGALCFNVSMFGTMLRPIRRRRVEKEDNSGTSDDSGMDSEETDDNNGHSKSTIGGHEDEGEGEDAIVTLSGSTSGSSERNGEPSLTPAPKDNSERSIFSRVTDYLGLSLFKDVSVVILMVVQFCGRFTYMGWLIYLIPHAQEDGIAPLDATFIASVAGISNIVSRGTHGLLVDHHLITAPQLLLLASCLAALPLLLDPLMKTYGALMCGSLLYGLASGVFFPISVVVVKQVVGPDVFPNALGWSYGFAGIGRMSAGYLTGYFYDIYGNYDVSFIVLGSVQAFASVILVINIIILWRREQNAKRQGVV